jgi:hypothetical protein
MVKGAALGFAAGIVIGIFLGRLGLFRRDNRIHNVIAKIWYVYIPLLVMGACLSLSAVYEYQSRASSFAESMRPEISELSFVLADGFLNSVKIASGDLTVSDVVAVARIYVGDRFDEYIAPNIENRSGFIKGLAWIFRSALLETLPSYIGSRIESMTAGALDISRERLTDIWNTDIRTALKNGLVSDIIRSEIARRFAALRVTVMLVLSLLLLPPVLETAVSLRYRRKRASAANA